MKKILAFFALLFCLQCAVKAQGIRPDQQPEQLNPSQSNWEFYSQKGGTPVRRTSVDTLGNKVFRPSIFSPFYPTPTGNANKNGFVRSPGDTVYYISKYGGRFPVSLPPDADFYQTGTTRPPYAPNFSIYSTGLIAAKSDNFFANATITANPASVSFPTNIASYSVWESALTATGNVGDEYAQVISAGRESYFVSGENANLNIGFKTEPAANSIGSGILPVITIPAATAPTGEIILNGYPNTRNDGNLTNILGTSNTGQILSTSIDSRTLNDILAVEDSTEFADLTYFDTPKAVIMTDVLRGGIFRPCTGCDPDGYMVIQAATGQNFERFNYQFTTPEMFGAIGDGVANDSAAWQRCLNFGLDIQAKKDAVYNVGTLYVNYPVSIQGNNSTLKLTTEKLSGTPVVVVFSDDVIFQGFNIVGKISDQTSEFSHGVCVGDPFLGLNDIGFKNVKIINCNVRNVRGDGYMVHSGTNTVGREFAENVIVSNCSAVNCYRNGLSAISVKNLLVENFVSDSIGFQGILIEPDNINQTIDNVKLSNCYISNFGTGNNLSKTNKNILIENCRLDGLTAGSNPNYTEFTASRSGVVIQHTENFKMLNSVVKNTKSYGVLFGSGTIKNVNIIFESCTFDSTTLSPTLGNYSKIIDSQNSTSDSCVIFNNCEFKGFGLIQQIGLPKGSVSTNCKFENVERMFVAPPGNCYLQNCKIGTIYDLIYATSNGGIKFDGCDIYSGLFIIRGVDAPNPKFTFRNCNIATPYDFPYSVFASDNAKIVWQNNVYNGSSAKVITGSATIWGTDCAVNAASATVTFSQIFATPENTFSVTPVTSSTITIQSNGGLQVNFGASVTSTAPYYQLKFNGTGFNALY